MKNLTGQFFILAGVSCLMLLGSTPPAFAADDNSPRPDDRLQRLEERINQVAERQEQMMRHMGGGMQERQGPMPTPGPGDNRFPVPNGPSAQDGAKVHRDIGNLIGLIMLVWILCNILLAIWIFTDIRRRGEGSGLFIVLALVAGIPAAIIYSLVRISDRMAITAPPGI
jgi:hypothetical protein